MASKGQPVVPVVRLLHHKMCRNGEYPGSTIQRYPVEDALMKWKKPFPDYQPAFYESPHIAGKPWSDPSKDSDDFKKIKFNKLDGKVNRISYLGKYKTFDGIPQNPIGRTGIIGRGLLGRWGPNHAADPIVTRWKRTESGEIVRNQRTGLGYLQMCAIKRKDCGKWAIPGGMVDPGENVTATLKREFAEEALSMNAAPMEVEVFFKLAGKEVYRGYVDDPRNTDNAWIETLAMNFHDENGDMVGRFNFKAGSDAARVVWKDIDRNVDLYANHSTMLKQVAENLSAQW
uniref:Putative transient receptor potential-related channel 7 n=1 Tax=Lutzomyia longipalpis TaxID=7200 RepID=A0A1B0C9E7_LUTLO